MRFLASSICLVLSVLVTGSAWAQDDAPNNEDRGDRRAEMRRRMTEEFDADGDGQLSDEERAKAREEMRSRRGNRGRADRGAVDDAPRGERADRARGDRPQDDRPRRDRDAAGRRGGLGEFPDPGELFNRFDADGNGQLSRGEFMKLSEEMRPPRPERGPGAAGRDGPPPREGDRRFDRQRPLQNPGDRPGPPRPEGRRRPNDQDVQARGPAGPDRRGPGERGPGERGPGARGAGPEGRPQGMLDPARIFERFDENGDDQLSREEFMKLSDRMRAMHERMQGGDQLGGDQPGGGPRGGPGMREGRGPRQGGPPEDGAPTRRRRPARPQFENDAKPAATDENSV